MPFENNNENIDDINESLVKFPAENALILIFSNPERKSLQFNSFRWWLCIYLVSDQYQGKDLVQIW